MLVAVDVQYTDRAAVTGVVGFTDWRDPDPVAEAVFDAAVAPVPYRPGEFAKRELPFLLTALTRAERCHPVRTVVVDGYVWLGDGRPGLGARLHETLAGPIVIGVAKTAFAGAGAVPVLRGRSSRPLFVTAAGIDAQRAAGLVRAMHGRHRLPTLLKRVDRLARGRAVPDPATGRGCSVPRGEC